MDNNKDVMMNRQTCKPIFSKPGRIVAVTALFILTAPLQLLAQISDPCSVNGEDPGDNACPLDSWIFLLAIVALLCAAVNLRKKGKLQPGKL